VNVAVAADLADGGEVREMHMVISALGARPGVIAGLDRVAVGRRLEPEVVDAVAERAFQQCHPLTNIIVDPDWRRAMVPVLRATGAGGDRGGVRRADHPKSCSSSSSRVTPRWLATLDRIAVRVPTRRGEWAGTVTWCSPSRSVVSRIWLPVWRVIR
jgi:hypothetical protein